MLQDERRIAENEVRFRAVNEDIDRGRPGTGAQTRVPFVCECGDEGCRRLVDLTAREYQAVRADAKHFFVIDGHEIERAEDVVERHEGWLVVRKTGVGAEVADPPEGQR